MFFSATLWYVMVCSFVWWSFSLTYTEGNITNAFKLQVLSIMYRYKKIAMGQKINQKERMRITFHFGLLKKHG